MRIDLQDVVRQIEAIHVGHPDAGQQEQNAGLVPLAVAEPFDSVGSGRHGVSSMLQKRFGESANADIIVDQQDRSALLIASHRPGFLGRIIPFEISATKICFGEYEYWGTAR